MATFTSVTSGNWNDGATWGMTSPGVKGTDWPGLAGDIVNIGTTAGQSHTVTYNVSETNQMATITIGATSGTARSVLTFSNSMNTLLCMGNSNIAIQATGELIVGDSGANKIPATYTAEIRFHPSTNNSAGMSGASGHVLKLYGDPDFYGNDYDAYLNADWTSGQTFTITGDFTTKWRAGQRLIVHKGNLVSVSTDVIYVTIASIAANGANTNITINESHPGGTFQANGEVFNFSRNVRLIKGGDTPVINTMVSVRWRMECQGNTAYQRNKTFASNVEVFGMHRGYWGTPTVFERMAFYGCELHCTSTYLFDDTEYSLITNSGGPGYIGGKITDSAYVAAAVGGTVGTTFSESVRILSNSSGISGTATGGANSVFKGRIYANNSGIYDGTGFLYQNAQFGFDLAGNQKNNTTDFRGANYSNIILRACKFRSTGPVFTSTRNTNGSLNSYCFENLNGVLGDDRVMGSFGDALRVDADGSSGRPQQRSGGGPDVIEITTQSNCSLNNYFNQFLKQQIWATAGVSRTYRYYVQTDYDSLPATEIELKAEYINDATNHTEGATVSDEAITTRSGNTDWSQYVEVTVNPSEDGWVRLSMKIMGYEATRKIWIDPVVSIT